MDYYNIACSWHESAKILHNSCAYRESIHLCCLAMESYLKSKLVVCSKDVKYSFERSHDMIGICRALCHARSIEQSAELKLACKQARKYFNESRYPYEGMDTYTKEFSMTFLEYTDEIKKFTDNIHVTAEDLKRHW